MAEQVVSGYEEMDSTRAELIGAYAVMHTVTANRLAPPSPA